MTGRVTLSELGAFLEATCTVALHADRAKEIVSRVQSIDDSEPAGGIVFLTARTAARVKREPGEIGALAAIVPAQFATDYAPGPEGPALVAWSHNPRLDFARAVERFLAPSAAPGVSPGADVSPLAKIAHDVSIAAGCVIGSATIGAGSVLGPGCHIGDDVVLGERCVLQPGVVIGAPGFGFERDETGSPVRVPHLGTVALGDDVEVGANACIDRATIGETSIGARTKIDNLVHIAHNVSIAEECLIAASAVVAGSARVGQGVWIGPSAVISDGITIGDGASVSLGAVVVRDVAPGTRVSGNFAVDHDRFMASWKRSD